MLLPLFSLTFFAASIASTVLGKKANIAISVYPLALSLLTGLTGAAIYPILHAVASRPASLAAYARSLRPKTPASQGHPLRLPRSASQLWVPPLIGACFALRNILQNIGARGDTVSGPVIAVSAKLVVPVSMALEALAPRIGFPRLYSRPTLLRIAAVSLLFLGVVATVFAPGQASSGGHDASPASYAVHVALLVASDVPLAVGILAVRQLYAATAAARPPTAAPPELVLWWWISLWELPWVTLLAPFNAYLQGFAPSAIPANVADGIACWVAGVQPSARSLATYAPAAVENGRIVGLDCPAGSHLFLASLISGLVFNICMPLITTRASSTTLLWVLRAAALPFAVLLFSLKPIMGRYATPIGPLEIIGMLVVAAALVLYAYADSRAASTPQPAAPDASDPEQHGAGSDPDAPVDDLQSLLTVNES